MVLQRVSGALFQRPCICGNFILKDIPGNATKTGSVELWSIYYLWDFQKPTDKDQRAKIIEMHVGGGG